MFVLHSGPKTNEPQSHEQVPPRGHQWVLVEFFKIHFVCI